MKKWFVILFTISLCIYVLNDFNVISIASRLENFFNGVELEGVPKAFNQVVSDFNLAVNQFSSVFTWNTGGLEGVYGWWFALSSSMRNLFDGFKTFVWSLSLDIINCLVSVFKSLGYVFGGNA